ncbi:hypothetical protein LSUE1_G005942 [Lachnellula suecica]|uniref:DUF7708 domain-containing protein n=1 Tax=Lachnellula suecica TaxID=602035 RepID=A0A8T9C598_9HELO|nr:hypothetical protein LSUE1_G005942 [Lachnellula suecica]
MATSHLDTVSVSQDLPSNKGLETPEIGSESPPVDFHVFQEVRDSFLGLIPENEKSQLADCSSFQAVLDQLRAQLENYQKGKRGRPSSTDIWIRKIERFGHKLGVYFDVINIVISSNPEYSALAWGAFRLVLLLSSNYTTFFEKLVILLERLSVSFDQYSRALEILRDASCLPGKMLRKSADFSRIQNAIIAVYTNLFQFFVGVMQVFTKKNGESRGQFSIINKIAWKPFNIRFQSMVESIDYSQNILAQELHLKEMEISNDTRKEATSKELDAETDWMSKAPMLKSFMETPRINN